MQMTKQCPKCGATEDEKDFIGSFCIDCYISMNKPDLPAKIVIYRCKQCGAERFSAWGTPVEEAIAHALKSKVFGTPEITIEDDYVIARYDKIDMEFKIPLKIKETTCNTCSQKSSGYYEAIIQLRGKYAHDHTFAQKIIGQLERITFIPKVEELKEGLDIYVGNKQAVAIILTALGIKALTSNKIGGMKNGKNVYRTTFLVRG